MTKTPDKCEKHWICELSFADVNYVETCPRCGKPCQWNTRVIIYSRGPFRSGTLHGPVCPCPDDHIREAIVKVLADALVKNYSGEGRRGSATVPAKILQFVSRSEQLRLRGMRNFSHWHSITKGLERFGPRSASAYFSKKQKTKPRTEVGCSGIIRWRRVRLCFPSRIGP
jgi:hypothetical protein